MRPKNSIKVRVDEATPVADQIKRFRFVPVEETELPVFSPGANITVYMDGPERRMRNQYSLMGSHRTRDAYEISVLHVMDSRGGSEYMHTSVKPGDELYISHPNNQFPIYTQAKKHLLIAGGIGITPFLSMMRELTAQGAAFELHYAFRSLARGAYVDELQKAYPGRVLAYPTDLGSHIAFEQLLGSQPLGTHLYVCGPEQMIEAIRKIADQAGWPEENIHWEKFLAPPPGDPFDVRLAESEMTVHVDGEQSILEAVEDAGVEPDFGCRGGVCGRCETTVLNVDGQIEHNDDFLSEEERAAGESIMICMSRFKGEDLTLKL